MGGVAVDGDDVYWLEGRPNEGGRNVLIRMKADGRRSTMTTWIQRPHPRAGIRRGRVRDRESRDLFLEFLGSANLRRWSHDGQRAGGAASDHASLVLSRPCDPSPWHGLSQELATVSGNTTSGYTGTFQIGVAL